MEVEPFVYQWVCEMGDKPSVYKLVCVLWLVCLVMMMACAILFLFFKIKQARRIKDMEISRQQKLEELVVSSEPEGAGEEVVELVDDTAEIEALWEEFSNQELEPELQNPVPGLHICAEPPTEEALREKLGQEYMQQLHDRYTSKEAVVEIARKFREWAADRPEGASLLLEAEEDVDYWVMGDLHSSFEVLLRAWAIVREKAVESGRKACLILLGDVIDRGETEVPCLAMIEDMLMKGGEDGVSLLCLRGNHDAALRRGRSGMFFSVVMPAETPGLLNEMIEDGLAEEAENVGCASIELARISPVVAELTSLGQGPENATILLVHAGVPHTDMQQYILAHQDEFTTLQNRPLLESVPESQQDKWVDDFTWIRLQRGVKCQPPNRGHMGCRMGVGDMDTYRRLHLKLTGRAITYVLRGHDHEPDGYRLYYRHPEYTAEVEGYLGEHCGVLGINSMCHMTSNPLFRKARPSLVHWSRGNDIELYRLPGKDEMRMQAQPPAQAPELPQVQPPVADDVPLPVDVIPSGQ